MRCGSHLLSEGDVVKGTYPPPSGKNFLDGRADGSTWKVCACRGEVLLKIRCLGSLLATQGSFDQGPRGIGLMLCFRVIFGMSEARMAMMCPSDVNSAVGFWACSVKGATPEGV